MHKSNIPNGSSFRQTLDIVPEFWLYVNINTLQHIVYVELQGNCREVSVTSSAHTIPTSASLQNGAVSLKAGCRFGKSNVKSEGSNTTLRTETAEKPLVEYALVKTDIPVGCLDALRQKDYLVKFRHPTEDGWAPTDCLELDVYVTNVDVGVSACDAYRPRKSQLSMQCLMEHFHGFSLPG